MASVRLFDGRAFAHISALVPDARDRVWFVAADGPPERFPVYDTTPVTAQEIIGECHGFEYYLVPRDFRWLLCENQHDVLMAAGEARQRLAALAAAQADPESIV